MLYFYTIIIDTLVLSGSEPQGSSPFKYLFFNPKARVLKHHVSRDMPDTSYAAVYGRINTGNQLFLKCWVFSLGILSGCCGHSICVFFPFHAYI